MDRPTLASYDADPQAFVQRWRGRPEPAEFYERLQSHFKPGPTADVGCGSGHDTAWLSAHGFPAVGYDASSGLLALAKAQHPHIEFAQAALPDLAGVGSRQFDNVLCNTVIMHLPRAEIASAVHRLRDLLRPGGVLYLSWRVTRGADKRDEHGRLYTAFESDVVHDALAGTANLFEEEIVRPNGQQLHRLIVRA